MCYELAHLNKKILLFSVIKWNLARWHMNMRQMARWYINYDFCAICCPKLLHCTLGVWVVKIFVDFKHQKNTLSHFLLLSDEKPYFPFKIWLFSFFLKRKVGFFSFEKVFTTSNSKLVLNTNINLIRLGDCWYHICLWRRQEWRMQYCRD